MEIHTHNINQTQIAEVLSDDILIATANEGLELLGNLYYQGFDKVILHEKNLHADFFDLKTGIAGEVLQKFANYRVDLAIVGDFSKYKSKSFQDFVLESNPKSHINFVSSVAEAISRS